MNVLLSRVMSLTVVAAITLAGCSHPNQSPKTGSGGGESGIRDIVRNQLAVLLSRPSFRVIRWGDENFERFAPARLWVLKGRVTFVNVFQEQASHEYVALFVQPDELLRIDIDGQTIWAKSSDNMSPTAQAGISKEELDNVYQLFSSRYEAKAKSAKPASAESTRGRLWTDRTERYTVRAKFLGSTASGLVRLEKQDAGAIEVAISELSSDDRKWIEEHGRTRPVRVD